MFLDLPSLNMFHCSFLNMMESTEWKNPTPATVSHCQTVNILSQTMNGLWLRVGHYTNATRQSFVQLSNINTMDSNSKEGDSCHSNMRSSCRGYSWSKCTVH